MKTPPGYLPRYFGRAPDIIHGIAWMMFATAGFVTSDAITKYLLQSFSITQVVWVRYAVHFAIVVVLFRKRLRVIAQTQSLRLQLFRSLLLLLVTISLFTAISTIPLATASAIILTAPLIVTALAGILLRENVTRHRWFCVILGFTGAFIIVQPSSNSWDPALLWAVAAAFFYALYQISTRALHLKDKPGTTLFYTALIGVLFTSLVVPFVWVTPAPIPLLLMILAGAVSGLSHYSLIKAFSAAPASTVTPFGYSSLIWSTCFGYLFFSELPAMTTFIGAAIIVGSGVAILRKEGSNSRAMEHCRRS